MGLRNVMIRMLLIMMGVHQYVQLKMDITVKDSHQSVSQSYSLHQLNLIFFSYLILVLLRLIFLIVPNVNNLRSVIQLPQAQFLNW